MPFDLAAFERAEFRPRTSRVELPELAAFFADGEPPQWEVRSLTASELQRASDAKQRQAAVRTIVDAIASAGDQAANIRKYLGVTNDTPGEVAKRMEMLVAGSVSPRVDLQQVVKLAEHYPIAFLTLTNEILELTGRGADMVKPGAASQATSPSSSA
jgi:hypothetical protein